MIIDNNVLFSLMKPDSSASRIFELTEIEFEAPAFIKSELDEHEGECMAKSGLSKPEFRIRKAEVFSQILFISVEVYKQFLKKALASVTDQDDAPYIALALAIKQPIWSNDMELKKQRLAEVLTTEDLIKILSK